MLNYDKYGGGEENDIKKIALGGAILYQINMQGYFNFNKLIMQVEKLPAWKAIWLGIKISIILIPTFMAFGYFIFGNKFL